MAVLEWHLEDMRRREHGDGHRLLHHEPATAALERDELEIPVAEVRCLPRIGRQTEVTLQHAAGPTFVLPPVLEDGHAVVIGQRPQVFANQEAEFGNGFVPGHDRFESR